jgi:hypothetical protein|tara:strand:+ start:2423 stop:2701 length:279 start_codon:yes stop_codon:yes gene_type:complete
MRYVWMGLLVGVLLAEAVALVHPSTSDTLSYQVWRLREAWHTRAVLLALYVWLGWHWFIESPSRRAVWLDDVAIVLVAAALAAIALRYAPHS